MTRPKPTTADLLADIRATRDAEQQERLAEQLADAREPVYGLCTACGSVEVELNKATGTRDLSGIGESSAYPTGYGCEVCA